MTDYNKGLISFLDESPTAFHAVASIKKKLVANDYSELAESEKWELTECAAPIMKPMKLKLGTLNAMMLESFLVTKYFPPSVNSHFSDSTSSKYPLATSFFFILETA